MNPKKHSFHLSRTVTRLALTLVCLGITALPVWAVRTQASLPVGLPEMELQAPVVFNLSASTAVTGTAGPDLPAHFNLADLALIGVGVLGFVGTLILLVVAAIGFVRQNSGS